MRSDVPAGNEFRVRVDSRPGIDIAETEPTMSGHDVALFHSNERPDFVALDPLTRQIAKRAVLVFGGRDTNIREQLGDGVDVVGHAGRGANRVSP